MSFSQRPHHQSLHLRNFTAFHEAKFEFAPGINVFVGANGTGKTHAMKALYAMQMNYAREHLSNFGDLLEGIFQAQDFWQLVRHLEDNNEAQLDWTYNGRRMSRTIRPSSISSKTPKTQDDKVQRPVFIPAMDMMGHTRGFTEAYEEVRLDFDVTCRDIVNLLRLERNGRQASNGTQAQETPDLSLSAVIGGTVERDDEGRFYLATATGRLPMPLVAEGLRKIATLMQLQSNGWLVPGTTLFWDEPEVNLNPILMNPVVSAILELSRSGVQVFLATHSYVILKELDLQAVGTDELRYFLFSPSEDGTQISTADDFARLASNPIMEEYDSLYDRDLTKSTGRNRRGERVS